MKAFFRSLQFRISLFHILLSSLTIGIISVTLYVSLSRSVLQDSIQSSHMAINKSASLIEMYVDRLKVLSELLANNPQSIRTLSSLDKAYEEDVLKLIQNVLDSDSYIQSIIVIGKDGYVISNEQNLNMTRSSDMMKESWYAAAIEQNNKPALTSARMQKFSMDKDQWVISISQEIKDSEGHNLGVVLLDIQYKGIEDYLNDLELGQNGFAYIVNSQGGLVYHKDPQFFIDVLKKEQLMTIYRSQDGYDKEQHTLVYKTKLNNTDWTLVGVNSLDGLNKVRNQLLLTFLIFGAALLIATAFAAAFIARGMTKPINRLVQAMQRVQQGELEVRVLQGGYTEVHGLSEHFNTMVLEVKRLLQEVESKERDLRAYELSVLHSQINPHFLYNTLDTIVWMAEFKDNERVIAITKALAKFFRLSLSGGNEYTSIENEMDHITQYLFIQKERYGEKLNYEIHYDPALSNKVIPKLLLQPLVENAIYHGIREKEGQGNLTITCRLDGEHIVFEVEDDGVGFDIPPDGGLFTKQGVDRAIEEGQIDEELSPRIRMKLGGVGLTNVDRRIKLYYGSGFGISIRSGLDEGTTVTIHIPFSEQL